MKLWKELSDPEDYYGVRSYLSHNLFLFIISIVTILLGLAAAALINNKPRGYSWFRVTYFFPNVLAVPAIALLWSMTLNPEYGLINNLLKLIGLESLALPWFSLQYELPGYRLGLYTVGFISIWAGLGWNMIILLAAIQNVPTEYHDAAMIDGASKWRAFFSVTLPLIWDTTQTLLIFAIIGALNTFALTFVLFEQTANRNSDVIMNYYYWQAFSSNNWGYASAIVVVVFAVTLIASIFTYRFSEREGVQY
jgi:ABC-type sugar transport system permease subunit